MDFALEQELKLYWVVRSLIDKPIVKKPLVLVNNDHAFAKYLVDIDGIAQYLHEKHQESADPFLSCSFAVALIGKIVVNNLVGSVNTGHALAYWLLVIQTNPDFAC